MIACSDGLVKSVSSWFGQRKGADAAHAKARAAEDDPDAIHIFTVASGHMYERLQKIMILSLKRQTECVPSSP